ncbi:T9SS type A sorting domain-containing protein [Winogradskyella rapida]|uniref:T9SS type A sorting domain-containing protein n=1 Tax=Winogradskyella rapida TaxID=549701 RepID=A0ABW3KW82_9FLAO
MNTILPTVFSFTASKKVMTAVLLFVSALSFSQEITDIFPRRLTTGSVVTILGTGFTSTTAGAIDTNINSTDVTLVSSTEMTYTVTSDYDEGDGGDITTRSIGLGNVGTSFATGVDGAFEFIAPANKILTVSSDFGVNEIYTTWDQNGDGVGFWKSSDFDSSNSVEGKATWPNDRHDLLGFKMNNGVIYSTGVDDDLLEDELTDLGVDITDATQYVSQEFNAYSSRGITGKPHGSNYLAMADKVDGVINGRVLNSSVLATVYDVIIDGVNGLDLGTGITNFNKDAEIKFYSGNGNVGALDAIPDLIITQMAQPGGSNNQDVYYYSDPDGNVVGRPVKLEIPYNEDSIRLFEWRLDLYLMDQSSSVTYENAYPTVESFGTKETRPFTMLALKLQDFEIDASNIDDVNNVNMAAGGSSDMAFMAYNKDAFDIKSPIVTEAPVSRYFCRFPTTESITFDALGSVEGGYSTPIDTLETITYQWFENFASVTSKSETLDSYTFAAGLTETDVENKIYKVRVENDYGSVDIPFTITKGGTPTYWDGSNWVMAPVYDGISIKSEDKSLIFSNDYNESDDLFGCDCTVSSGKNVVIPQDSKIILVNELTVEDEIPEFTDEEEYTSPYVAAGTFTLEDDASLVQINDVENSGEIIVKRTVEGATLHANDFVYWSSPVESANLSSMPGTSKYQWDVDGANSVSGTVGNWTSATDIMEIGRGYIARVPSAIDYTAVFTGTPNNGDIDIEVKKTPTSGSTGMDSGDKHWNLIGSPYPSAIDPAKLLINNTNLEGAVYVWTHSDPISASASSPFYDNFGLNYSDQYVAYNGTGASRATNEGENYIASGQGFFVKVLNDADDTSNVTFTNAMRHNDAEEAYDNDQFYRSSSTEAGITTEKQLLWLSLANENDSAISTLIGYVEGATEGKDRVYDAQTNNGGFNIYSLTSEDDNLVIQGLPLPFIDYNTVPLGYEVSASGIYRIAIADVKGSVFEEQEQDIYVEDTYTGVVHDLRASTYAFTSESGAFNDRFILRYTPPVTLSVDEIAADTTFAFINNATLNVKSSDGITAIEVYDMNGKKVVNYTLRGSENTFNTNFNFARGVYVASITLDNGSVVTKKLMN